MWGEQKNQQRFYCKTLGVSPRCAVNDALRAASSGQDPTDAGASPRSPGADGTSVLLSPKTNPACPKVVGGWQGCAGAAGPARGLAINQQNQSSQYSWDWCQSLCSGRGCHLVQGPPAAGDTGTPGPVPEPKGTAGADLRYTQVCAFPRPSVYQVSFWTRSRCGNRVQGRPGPSGSLGTSCWQYLHFTGLRYCHFSGLTTSAQHGRDRSSFPATVGPKRELLN